MPGGDAVAPVDGVSERSDGVVVAERPAAPPRPPVIWIVNQYTGSPRHGMEYRHYYLGRLMAERGLTVVVVSGSYSHLFTRAPDVSARYTREAIDGLTYCWIAVPRYGAATSGGRVLNMVAFALWLVGLPTTRLPRPDAILVSSPSPFPIVVAARWARRWNARLVFEVRDIWPLSLREIAGVPRLHPLMVAMQWCEDYAYRAADRVVSVLPMAAEHMVSRGMAPEKFRYLPNGIDLHAADVAGAAPDAVADAVRPGAFTVGFIGTLGTANAVETLIDAARLLDADRFRVVIVGHGHERDRLMRRAEGLRNVTFVGPIPKEQVVAAMHLFDACYVGYRRSSLYRFGISPNKLFEYMAAARPIVLAADASNLPVDEAQCGRTVPPEDPTALAAAIRSLAACPAAERARLGANARAYVAARHDYAVLADELTGILVGDRR
jgi:glycosyltransferase involved in cell wall biosynthesis